MTRIILLLLLSAIASTLRSQSSFHKIYDIDGPFNYGNAILALADSGYVIGGNKHLASGEAGPALLRVDPDGQVVWLKNFTSTDGGGGHFSQVLRTEDGGFLALGTLVVGPSGGDQRILLVKTDAEGNEQWRRNLRFQAQFTKARTVPGGYVLAGVYSQADAIGDSDGFLVRLDQDGEIVWSQEYGRPQEGLFFRDLWIENDTIFVVGNYDTTVTFQTQTGFFGRVALDDGTLYSLRTYDHPGGTYILENIFPTADGHFLINGTTGQATAGGQSIYATTIQKIRRDGTLLWAKKLYSENGDLAQPIASLTTDGGLLLCGSHTLTKVNADAEVQFAWLYSKSKFNVWADITEALDGGIMVVGGTRITISSNRMWLSKLLPDGRVDNCCTLPLLVNNEPFSVNPDTLIVSAKEFIQLMQVPQLVLSDGILPASDFCPDTRTFVQDTVVFCAGDSVFIDGLWYDEPGTITNTIPGIGHCDTVATHVLQTLPLVNRQDTVAFCPGTSVIIDGNDYSEPGTVTQIVPAAVGCDTLVTHILRWLPQPVKSVTLAFCPGDSVLIGGNVYTQPGTVTGTVPATLGCDTLVSYTLEWLPQPVKSETIIFCPGDSVLIGGIVYTQPGTVVDTLPAASGCDTIATYVLQPASPSVVSMQCPGDLLVAVPAGTASAVVNYAVPAAVSDCPCGSAVTSLLQGLPSGAAFPLGLTTICYGAADGCGTSASCCFSISVDMMSSAADPAQEPPPFLTITPNPASDRAAVRWNLPAPADAVLDVHDMLGRLIASRHVGGKTGLDLPVSDWPKGSYVVTLRSSGWKQAAYLVR